MGKTQTHFPIPIFFPYLYFSHTYIFPTYIIFPVLNLYKLKKGKNAGNKNNNKKDR
jgi:hypothetical protein